MNKTTSLSFNEAIAKVTEELKKEGFGIITEVDLKEKFKENLDVDFHNYKILGACNPAIAFKAVQIEDKIGVLLPCNVLIQQKGDKVEIAAINPLHSIGSMDNQELESIANEVSTKLKKVIDQI